MNVFPSDLDLLKLMSLNMERLNYILCHKSSFHIVKFGKWEHRPSSHYRSIQVRQRKVNRFFSDCFETLFSSLLQSQLLEHGLGKESQWKYWSPSHCLVSWPMPWLEELWFCSFFNRENEVYKMIDVLDSQTYVEGDHFHKLLQLNMDF